MGIRVYKPTTNGRRNMTSLDFAEITTSTPEKSLLVALKSKAGRTTTVVSQFVTKVVDTNVSTVWLTSNVRQR